LEVDFFLLPYVSCVLPYLLVVTTMGVKGI
jgi:hypothetical protein